MRDRLCKALSSLIDSVKPSRSFLLHVSRILDFTPALSCSAWAVEHGLGPLLLTPQVCASRRLSQHRIKWKDSCKTDEGGDRLAAMPVSLDPPAPGAGKRAGRVGIMTKVTSTCAQQSVSNLAVYTAEQTTTSKPEETSTSFHGMRNGGLDTIALSVSQSQPGQVG